MLGRKVINQKKNRSTADMSADSFVSPRFLEDDPSFVAFVIVLKLIGDRYPFLSYFFNSENRLVGQKFTETSSALRNVDRSTSATTR